MVPRERPPVLVVALTYRVKSWIERTSRVAEVIHAPRIGLEAARLIAGGKPDAAVGIADLDGLPAGIADDLREGGPRLTLRDATALFVRLRGKADPAEIALAIKAASIAQEVLSTAPTSGADLGDIIADVEARARPLGAEEVYMAAAPDLARDQRLRRIEGTAALRRALRAARDRRLQGHVDPPGADLLRRRRGDADEAAARFAAAVAELPSERGFAGFSSWLVEGCRIAQPLAPLMGSRVAEPIPPLPGALVSVQAAIEIGGKPLLLGAPALIGEIGEAASLLVHPL